MLKPFDIEIIHVISAITRSSDEPIIETLHSKLKKHFLQRQKRYSNTKISQSILRLIKADILREEDRKGRRATFRFFRESLSENGIEIPEPKEEKDNFSSLLKKVEMKLIEKKRELIDKDSEKARLESEIPILRQEVEGLENIFNNAVSSLEDLREAAL